MKYIKKRGTITHYVCYKTFILNQFSLKYTLQLIVLSILIINVNKKKSYLLSNILKREVQLHMMFVIKPFILFFILNQFS